MKNPWVVHNLFAFVCCSYLFICSCMAFIGCISHMVWFESFFFYFISVAFFELGCTFVLNTELLEMYALNSYLQLQHSQSIILRCSSVLMSLLRSSLPCLVSSWSIAYSRHLVLFPSGFSVLYLWVPVNEVLLWFWEGLPLFVCFPVVG